MVEAAYRDDDGGLYRHFDSVSGGECAGCESGMAALAGAHSVGGAIDRVFYAEVCGERKGGCLTAASPWCATCAVEWFLGVHGDAIDA